VTGIGDWKAHVQAFGDFCAIAEMAALLRYDRKNVVNIVLNSVPIEILAT